MAPRKRMASTPAEKSDRQQQSQPLISRYSSTPSETSPNGARHSVVNSHQEQAFLARERHDFFNLFALLFIIGATTVNWDLGKLARGYGPDVAWTGKYFYLNCSTTILYYLVDMSWVVMVPTCVKSPRTIIKHHFAVTIYFLVPIFWPEYRWFMGAFLSIEISTWFLILRRVVYKRQSLIPAICIHIIDMLFYTTWIVIRCFILPGLLIEAFSLAGDVVTKSGHFRHLLFVFIPLHFFLCLLNFKWTYDLFEPIIRGRRDGLAKKVTVASGL
jgi:hypothetical protein